MLLYQFQQVGFGFDRNSFGVQFPGQLGGVFPPIDLRNLCRRKGHDFDVLIVAIESIEIVEVSSGGTHDDDFLFSHLFFSVTVK